MEPCLDWFYGTEYLFKTGKFCLRLYFGKLNPGNGYGAADSIIIIMLWVSYYSMIVFFGTKFTRTYANFILGSIVPKGNAKSDIHINSN